MVADYKLHDFKPDTPVIHYKCAYCGKEGVRRASKVKNPNLIFCDNSCSVKYRYKKTKKISDEDIKRYYNLYYQDIRNICAYICKRFNIWQHFDELLRESNNVIYRCCLNSKTKDVQKPYLIKSINKYLIYYVVNFVYQRKKINTMHIYEVDFERTLISDTTQDIDVVLDDRKLLMEVVKSARSKSSKIFLFSEIYGRDKVKELYRINDRVLTYNRSYGRKSLYNSYARMKERSVN